MRNRFLILGRRSNLDSLEKPLGSGIVGAAQGVRREPCAAGNRRG